MKLSDSLIKTIIESNIKSKYVDNDTIQSTILGCVKINYEMDGGELSSLTSPEQLGIIANVTKLAVRATDSRKGNRVINPFSLYNTINEKVKGVQDYNKKVTKELNKQSLYAETHFRNEGKDIYTTPHSVIL